MEQTMKRMMALTSIKEEDTNRRGQTESRQQQD
jgi:hypothetical protein